MSEKPKRTITQAEYLQAVGLWTLARRWHDKTQEAEDALAELLGLEKRDNRISDELWTDGSLDEGLKKAGIEVEPKGFGS